MKKIIIIVSFLITLSTFFITKAEDKEKIIILDAGHGGNDPGAVINDFEEDDINLSFVMKLKYILEDNNYKVLLTRSDNFDLCDGKFNKKEDMNKRIDIINNSNAILALSIHMNMYSNSKYSGGQVFYSNVNDKNKLLARCIMDNIKLKMKNTNREIVKRDNVYLLNKVSIPIVIIECGFMSNKIELANLLSDLYQFEFCSAIYNGIVEYLLK